MATAAGGNAPASANGRHSIRHSLIGSPPIGTRATVVARSDLLSAISQSKGLSQTFVVPSLLKTPSELEAAAGLQNGRPNMAGSTICYYRPAVESEALRCCRLASLEANHSEWKRRTRNLEKEEDNRRQAMMSDRVTSAQRQEDARASQSRKKGRRDLDRMLEMVAFEKVLDARMSRFEFEQSREAKAALAFAHGARLGARLDAGVDAIRRNHVLTQAAQKHRELSFARVAAEEDIARQCHRRRSRLPGTPHEARQAFGRFEACQALHRPGASTSLSSERSAMTR